MTEPQATTVPCPQCAGDNAVPSGEPLLSCEFCGATLFLDRSGVVGHYWLPRLLDAEQAQQALRRWMAGNDTVKDLDRKSTIQSAVARSFPVWLFRSRDGGDGTTYVEPAAPTPIPQLADLKIPAGQLQPFQAEDAVERSVATIPLETARRWLEERGVENVVESSLVQLPLWECRYTFAGDSFVALVDGSTGQVMAAVYPEKAETPYVLVAGLGLLVFLVLGLAISNPLLKLVAYGIVALPMLLIAYWVTRKV